MILTKAENKIIVRPDGKEAGEDYINKFSNGSLHIAKACNFFRLEHPHCAFFKSADDESIVKTTLYTPEGRLHIEEKPDCEDYYVKKSNQQDILLFFLRDVEVKPSLTGIMTEADTVEMPKTPLCELLAYVQKDVFDEMLAEYDITLKHIFSQLRRIYNEKLDIIAKRIESNIDYAVFDDIPYSDISEELLERWHLYYVRKARLLKKG